MPRSFTNDDSPPFNQPVLKTSKRSNTSRISSYLYRPSDGLAWVMMQPDPKSLNMQDPELERQQKADIEMAEDRAPHSGPFPQAEEEATDTGIIDQVFWGAARALHLLGREDAGNHGISRHLVLPMVSPMLPASFSRCIVWPKSRREQLKVRPQTSPWSRLHQGVQGQWILLPWPILSPVFPQYTQRRWLHLCHDKQSQCVYLGHHAKLRMRLRHHTRAQWVRLKESW